VVEREGGEIAEMGDGRGQREGESIADVEGGIGNEMGVSTSDLEGVMVVENIVGVEVELFLE